MPDWDADSAQLYNNLLDVLQGLRKAARDRVTPTLDLPLAWHQDVMRGLTPDRPEYVGQYRYAAGLRFNVHVGDQQAVDYEVLEVELSAFENRFKQVISTLDETIPIGHDLTTDDLAAVIDVCAWVHAEWVRLHPFANGNGRTARLWANFVAMRYGLPPFVRLRPRPDGGYGMAADAAMSDNWELTIPVFRRMLQVALIS